MKKQTMRILTALVLFALASSACVLIPVRTTGTRDARELAEPDSRFAAIAGIDIHYKFYPSTNAEKDRPLILLLHGFGASTYSWREVAVPLTEYGDVLAYDRPAFGLSDRPLKWKGTNPYSQEAQVDIAMGLMDLLGYKRAVLVGNSAGGTVALNIALEHPERVAALVLISPAVYGGGGAPGLIRPLFWLPGVNNIGPLLARRLSVDGDDFLRSAWFDESRIGPEVIPAYRAPLSIANWEKALWQLTKATKSTKLPKRVGGIDVPTLIVTGDTDRIVPTEKSVQLSSDMPGSTLVVIPRSGHVSHEETPAAFMEAFAQFWDKNLSAR